MTKLDFEQGDDVPDRIDVARPGEIDVLGDGEALDWTDEDAAFMADWDAAGSDGGDDEAAVDPFDVLIDRVADSVLDVDDDALRGFFLRLASQHGFRAAQYRALVAAFASRHVDGRQVATRRQVADCLRSADLGLDLDDDGLVEDLAALNGAVIAEIDELRRQHDAHPAKPEDDLLAALPAGATEGLDAAGDLSEAEAFASAGDAEAFAEAFAAAFDDDPDVRKCRPCKPAPPLAWQRPTRVYMPSRADDDDALGAAASSSAPPPPPPSFPPSFAVGDDDDDEAAMPPPPPPSSFPPPPADLPPGRVYLPQLGITVSADPRDSDDDDDDRDLVFARAPDGSTVIRRDDVDASLDTTVSHLPHLPRADVATPAYLSHLADDLAQIGLSEVPGGD